MKKRSLFSSILFIGVIILCLGNSISAQNTFTNNKFKTYWYVNVSGGLSLFFGDIEQISEWRLGSGMMLGRQFSPVFGLRTQSIYGQLFGSREEFGLLIEGDYIEFNFNATFSLSNLISKYKPDRKTNFYAIVGFGLTNLNMTQKSYINRTVLQLSGHGHGKGLGGRTLEGLFIGGLGFNYKLDDKLNLNFESAMRGINSDKVDIYISGKKRDYYNYTSFGITYKFGQKTRKKDRIPPPTLIQEKKTVEIPVAEIEKLKEKIVEEIVIKEKNPKKIIPIVPVIPEIEYRVQIRACFGKKLSIEKLSEQINIPAKQIKEDFNNGYYIYTVGSYTSSEEAEARVRRNKVILNNDIYDDAFIVCFIKGKRFYP
jgi:hypothetical protein